ncbi:MAG: translation initiation factor eIF-2B [Candidatus Hodarchaeales archaeon]|jgi:ribose 1,5-bisphosphate isomerase
MSDLGFDNSDEFRRLNTVLDDIKGLKIQGAAAVAQEGVDAYAKYAEAIYNKISDHDKLIEHLHEMRLKVEAVRATEPGMRNGLRYVYNKALSEGFNRIREFEDEFFNLIKESKEKVAEYGSHRIFDGDTIMTHCRSSFTEAIFVKAAEQGKKFTVIATETRPVFQGRKTTKRLSKHGIKIIHVVDSAMRWVMNRKRPRSIFIGADSVTVEGVALNKIGSRLLALSAKELHVPLYVCTSLLKYDPATNLGRLSEIEMRDITEVWENHPDGVTVLNPAFETISRRYIDGYITEFGVIPPQSVWGVFNQNYSKFIDA